ncbi:MAG: M18 family aminopeptidase [Helcococcus sp.]|nr:M18 family aminopeptidase [Helcococcus sp.]
MKIEYEKYYEDFEEEDLFIADYLNYLDESVSMYHSTNATKQRLKRNGFVQIDFKEEWNLESEGKYFLVVNDSTIIAFSIGTDKEAPFKIVGAHTDSPTFKIKSNPLIKKSGYALLNTEIYGGPLVNTWIDRTLSIAGRVFVKGESRLKPEVKLVNLDYDLLTIASLAIHMTSMDERGKLPNPQTQLIPVIGLSEDFDLDEIIADELEISKKDILSTDLFLYNRERANVIGSEDEFIQSGKIDNLGMMHAGLKAIIDSKQSKQTKIFVGFDNEEIGSGTQQGARSTMFKDVLKKISYSLGNDEITFVNQIYNSFMISADQAHAIHPNYLDKADPTNRPQINKGPVIKESASRSYATDGFGKAVLIDIAKENNIPLQFFHNRSDLRGGSTIGSLIEIASGIKNIDIGNPMLAMHSVREMCGVEDHIHMAKLMQAFYEAE